MHLTTGIDFRDEISYGVLPVAQEAWAMFQWNLVHNLKYITESLIIKNSPEKTFLFLYEESLKQG